MKKSFAQSVSQDRIVYKQADGQSLSLDVFKPDAKAARSGPGACAVLFHGGGFDRGSSQSMVPMAQALAAAGMTAFSVEYRLIDRSKPATVEPLMDAKSAMRWVRANAARFNCAPDRIAAGGRSAGGTLALAVAMVSEFDDPKDDKAVSAVPNALVLFNPGVDIVEGHESDGPLDFRMKISPLHLLDKVRIPPTVILHGTADKVVPYETVVAFRDKAVKLGNKDVTLIPYEGRGHGFFRKNKRNGEDFDSAIDAMVQFFKRLGWV